jgi:hypothetical protein
MSTARYYANVGPVKGPLRYRDVPGSIGVLEAPDKPMPIGQAMCKTWDEQGRAVWELTIGGHQLPGRWVIVDRQFHPVKSDGGTSIPQAEKSS